MPGSDPHRAPALRVRWRRVGTLSALLLAQLGACGGPHVATSKPIAPAPGASAHVQIVKPGDRPALTLVERAGDPSGAVAVAIADSGGPATCAALASLLTTRLQAAGVGDIHSSVDGLGFQLAVFAPSAEVGRTFVAAVERALSTPIDARDTALPNVRRALALLATAPLGRAAREVAECSGELVPTSKADAPNLDSGAGISTLDGWRVRAYSARTASFSAVGPRALLDTVSDAVGRTRGWPAGDDATLDGPWPTADVAGATATRSPYRRVSVALRVGDPNSAAAAAAELSASDALAERMLTIAPGSELQRVWYTARPRGACLRVDLALSERAPAPTAQRLAMLALGLRDEMDYALEHAPHTRWSLEQAIAAATDPRAAASVAAWLALGGRLPFGATRQSVVASLPAPEVDAIDANLLRAIQSQDATRPTAIEQLVRVESGQGQIWALLASPCGTYDEAADNAGVTALTLRSLAMHRARTDGVDIEPWVTPDGVGLLVHGAPLPAESPEVAAERVGRVLARAIAARPSNTDTASARASLLERLSAGAGAGWWTILESLAPGHSSWLQATGTWASVSEVTAASVPVRQALLLGRPLRLAVLANAAPAQATAIQQVVERWLRPVRGGVQPCTERPGAMPRSGVFSVETSDDSRASASTADGFVAVPVTPNGNGLPAEAEVTALLLNGAHGWLARALVGTGLAASARAVVIGGRRAAALVIEVRAVGGKLDGAVAQLRALLTRLAQGGVNADDARTAIERWTEQERSKELDPRYRIVRLWTGEHAATPPTAATLQRFLRGIGPQSHVVVTVKARP